MSDLNARLVTVLQDRYRIERELGQGGMATAYVAEDLRHARKVAIRVLRPEPAAMIGAERFVQEIPHDRGAAASPPRRRRTGSARCASPDGPAAGGEFEEPVTSGYSPLSVAPD